MNSQSVSVTFAVVDSETAVGVYEFAVGVCESGMAGQRGDWAKKIRPLMTPGEPGKMGSASR